MGLRLRLLLPLLVAGLVLLTFLEPAEVPLALGWLIVALAIVWALLELRVRRPLRRLADFVAAALRHDYEVPAVKARDELKEVADGIARLRDELRDESAARARADQQCVRAEQAVREGEERYALAISGANDGLWELDIESRQAYYSPRWKKMLDYQEADIGSDIGEWRDRIHPDDRERAIAKFDAHIRGGSDRFEDEHRLRAKGGDYRWIHARGTAIRNAAGRAYRVVGLNTDITVRKRAEEILLALSEGLASLHGEAFFDRLVCNFATVLGVRRAFLTECVGEGYERVRMLAYWSDGAAASPREYDVINTPCSRVFREGRTIVYECDLERFFPEREKGWQSYVGIPIRDGEEVMIGHLVCLDTSPLKEAFPLDAIYTLFAVRAGIELERQRLVRRLAEFERADALRTTLH